MFECWILANYNVEMLECSDIVMFHHCNIIAPCHSNSTLKHTNQDAKPLQGFGGRCAGTWGAQPLKVQGIQGATLPGSTLNDAASRTAI